MQCADFEKQFLLEGGVCSPTLLEHYASCPACQQYVQVHELLLPDSMPTPSAALDQRVRRQALAQLRRQNMARRWRRWTVLAGQAAAVLVLCLGLWHFWGGQAGSALSGGDSPATTSLVASAGAEDAWMMQWGLAYSELDDLEIDLTLHTALAGNWQAKNEQRQLPTNVDALQNLSNELLMLEFDLYENL